MKTFVLRATFIALISAFGGAIAQSSATTMSPSDSKATVPSVSYRSVFRETSLGIEQEKIDWRKANNDVGRFERGHVDILKSEEMDAKKASSPSPTPTPTPAPAPAPRSNSTHRH
jgi:hypothetical protein